LFSFGNTEFDVIIISFEVHISFQSASNTYAFIIFSQFSNQSISFSNIQSLLVVVNVFDLLFKTILI
jgi:hypothetical protein